MICKIMYFKENLGKYGGVAYTYRTELPLKIGDKVLAPTKSGDKSAVVTEIDLPESVIDARWADAVKTIVAYDEEGHVHA